MSTEKSNPTMGPVISQEDAERPLSKPASYTAAPAEAPPPSIAAQAPSFNKPEVWGEADGHFCPVILWLPQCQSPPNCSDELPDEHLPMPPFHCCRAHGLGMRSLKWVAACSLRLNLAGLDSLARAATPTTFRICSWRANYGATLGHPAQSTVAVTPCRRNSRATRPSGCAPSRRPLQPRLGPSAQRDNGTSVAGVESVRSGRTARRSKERSSRPPWT